MTENEAIQKARDWVLKKMRVELGTPKKVKYYSKGGQYIDGQEELKKLPYWEVTFYVKSGWNVRVDSGPFGPLYNESLERSQRDLADAPPPELKFVVWTNGSVAQTL